MRIAQVSFHLECGGATAMFVALSAELAGLGHNVDAVCLDRPTGSDHERQALNILDRHGVKWCSLGRKVKDPGLTTLAKLWRLVQVEKYDIVHSHLPGANAITGVVRHISPVRFGHVITIHTTVKLPKSALVSIYTSCSRGANVAYCSHAALKRNPMDGFRGVVIPNGIDLGYYRGPGPARSLTRRRLGLPDSATVVIAVGRLSAEKNYDCAIRGIARLKRQAPGLDVRCVICGDGPEKESLAKITSELNLDDCVHFLGSRTDTPELLGASDIFLSTSLSEGMPLAVLEALAAGLPCVLSSIDEHHEIADNMAGCAFVRPNSHEEVSHALQAFVDRAMVRNVLKRLRQFLLEQFSIRACAMSYLALYQTLHPEVATA